LVITPHAGEMATFLDISRDDVTTRRSARGRATAAAMLQARGRHEGRMHARRQSGGRGLVMRSRQVALATSGSGDTLAGIIAGLLARGASPPRKPPVWGVYMHGEAGNRLAGHTHGGFGSPRARDPAEIPPSWRIWAGEG
jgi:NAD(P)H-hydrate repair Nnr-like enzyme with NAD(P)H-hydrate dehydratase domain